MEAGKQTWLGNSQSMLSYFSLNTRGYDNLFPRGVQNMGTWVIKEQRYLHGEFPPKLQIGISLKAKNWQYKKQEVCNNFMDGGFIYILVISCGYIYNEGVHLNIKIKQTKCLSSNSKLYNSFLKHNLLKVIK